MPLDPNVPPALHPDGRFNERLAALERRLRTLDQYLSGGSTQQVPVVLSLPTAGRKGRLVVLNSDNKLYVDNGAAWVAQT